jgi:hypothetical protein
MSFLGHRVFQGVSGVQTKKWVSPHYEQPLRMHNQWKLEIVVGNPQWPGIAFFSVGLTRRESARRQFAGRPFVSFGVILPRVLLIPFRPHHLVCLGACNFMVECFYRHIFQRLAVWTVALDIIVLYYLKEDSFGYTIILTSIWKF